MKSISLIRTDEKEEQINISLGEAVIGRGPLLKCLDKRISRNHGMIKLSENGDIILTAKHLNPIYYSEKKQPLVEIQSGHSVTLNDGDEFALLPDSYRFRVILSDNETQNIQNGCINGESALDKNLIQERVQPTGNVEIKHEIQSESEKLENAPDIKEVHKTECLEIKQEVQSEPEKLRNAVDNSSVPKQTRNLPAWMTDTQNIGTPGSSGAVKKERKRKDNVKNKIVTKKAKITKKNADEYSGDEEGNNELQSEISESPQKNKPGKSGKDNDDDKDEIDIGDKTCEKRTKAHELSDEEEENKNDVAEEQTATSSEENKSNDKDEAPSSADQKVVTNNTRQKCLYGAGCYRRNPRHRTDFSHPGDADYDDGNIPECPYGVLCYRKNKQHRLDYKHITVPQQQVNPQNKKRKNAGTRKNYAEDDDDEEDDYDYDDPFLNDASSDDYQPTDSDSDNSAPTSGGEEEQDTKRMLKEAKKFTRKKK